MSLFTPKRKGRRISTFEDEDQDSGSVGEDGSSPAQTAQAPLRFGKRPLKQSALRRSINVHDTADSGKTDDDASRGGEEEEDDGPVVVRPTISRSGSTRSKKRMSTASRLSFGGDNLTAAGHNDDDDDDKPASTPKRTGGASSLTQRVLETNAFRSSLSGRLPTRPHDPDDDGGDGDDDRPRYSQAYLEELQNATPNTPPNLASKKKSGNGDDDADDMELDASELEGAMIVDAAELARVAAAAVPPPPPPAAHVLTATEIQERKDRRARLAREQDAIALGSDDDEAVGYISLVSGRDKASKKETTRLVREDEDLGEGFDEFVEDGGLSLGRKAERAERRRRKQEMASLISAAEGEEDAEEEVGGGDEDASEAEAERAYNAAQTRAGMDGLQQERRRRHHENDAPTVRHGGTGVPKMRPLPELADCLGRMQATVQALAAEAAARRTRLAAAEAEKHEIVAREAEVQKVLDAAGQKYKAMLASTSSSGTVSQSPLRPLPPGLADAPAERGLESLGATPTRRADVDNVF